MYKILNNLLDTKNRKINLLINDQKILKISQTKIITKHKCEVFDFHRKTYVSAGWIDSHVHAWTRLKPYGDNPDKIGFYQGVSTIIDAGSFGLENIHEFHHYIQKFNTNVYGLINLSKTGITVSGELKNNKDYLSSNQFKNIKNEFQDFILGIKIRMSNSIVLQGGLDAIERTNEISIKNNIPIMMHIGSAPPAIYDILCKINTNNYVITHAFHGKQNSIFNDVLSVKKVKKMKNLLDVGHGSASYNWKVFEKAKFLGFHPTIISTDIYKSNRENGPVFSLAHVLSKIYSFGYDLDFIIKCVTENPATFWKLKNKGKLAINMSSDLTFFQIQKTKKQFYDSDHNLKEITKLIRPTHIHLKGKIYNVKEKNLW